MIRWIAALLASIAILYGAYTSFTQYNDLQAARGELIATRKRAADAVRAHESAEVIARIEHQRANEAEAIAQKYAERAEWKPAYHAQVTATDHLKAENEVLTEDNARLILTVRDFGDASKGILDATKPSFLKSLIPKVGVGAAAGYDPIHNRVGVVVGPTLSWSF